MIQMVLTLWLKNVGTKSQKISAKTINCVK